METLDIYRNDIHTLKSGTFHFSQTLYSLSLDFNQINSIEAGAFQGSIINNVIIIIINIFLLSLQLDLLISGSYGNKSVISLSYNNLTRFEEYVFQSVLEQIEPFGGWPNTYVPIANSRAN